MALSAGQPLSFYEILGPLGAGGMGEVYRARDKRLEREVAIKVLPPHFADDEERLRRFQREAKTLASLNHPNVAQVFGIDQVEDTCFIAMELVEGEDLAERLHRGPLPIDETIEVCRQIAEGLEAAHEKGVVHRDLKPANVRITPEGVVKVLDFGLAKPTGPAASAESSTRVRPDSFLATTEGVVLGTPTYMSPEQARGRPVDRRTDVWAFGCVLFECLAGARAFGGASMTDTLAAIVEREPDWAALPAETPTHVVTLLRRCLLKDPRARLRDIGEARVQLSGVLELVATPLAARTPTRGTPWLPWALALVSAVLAIVFALRSSGSEGDGSDALEPSGGASRSFVQRTFGRQTVFTARFLPDGQSIVYSSALVGNRPQLFLLNAGAMSPRELAPRGTLLLSVSPTGELAVLTETSYRNHRVHEGTLARMQLDGAPRSLVESVRDADWGPDGELAVVRRSGGLDGLEYPLGTVLYRTAGYVSEPRVSHDGRLVAFLDHPASYDDRGRVKVVDLEGEVRTLSPEYWAVQGLTWSPDGSRLVYSGSTSDIRLQPSSVGLDGAAPRPELSVPGALFVVDAASDGRWLALAPDDFYGVAVHLPGRAEDVDLSWLDLSWGGFLSPDGQQLLFTNGHGGADYTTVTRRIDGSPIVTLGVGDSMGFSPDGRWALALVYSAAELVLYPTGAGEPRTLERGPITLYERAQWFPDGQHVLVIGSEPSRPPRAYRQSIAGGPPRPVTPEGVVGYLSPAGDRLIGEADDGTWQLVVIDPEGGASGDPTPAPGMRPSDEFAGWSREGDAVFVGTRGEVPRRLERVDLATGAREPSLTVGPRDQVGLVLVWCSGRIVDPTLGFAYGYRRTLSNLYVVGGGT